MTDLLLEPYQVRAFNTAHDSENKIHDDATARRFGFSGGLVPGVDVYGYMSHLPVTRWGRAWLERGTAECRFFKPVYDGDAAIVTARDSGGGIEILGREPRRAVRQRARRPARSITRAAGARPFPPSGAAPRAAAGRRGVAGDRQLAWP